MCAVGRHCVKAILGLDEQDLAALNTLDLILSLLAVLEVDAGQALELVFGGHIADGVRKVGSLGTQACWQLYNGLTEEMRCVTEGGEHRRKGGWMYGGGVEEEELPCCETTALRCQLARHGLRGRGRVCVQTTSRWKMQRRRQRKQPDRHDDALIHYC